MYIYIYNHMQICKQNGGHPNLIRAVASEAWRPSGISRRVARCCGNSLLEMQGTGCGNKTGLTSARYVDGPIAI